MNRRKQPNIQLAIKSGRADMHKNPIEIIKPESNNKSIERFIIISSSTLSTKI